MQALQAAHGEFARPTDESCGASVPGDRCARARGKRRSGDTFRFERAIRDESASAGARVSERDGNYAAAVCRRATNAAAEISIEKRRRRDNGTV